ncbi:MAG: hypothetical protein WA777_19270 [Rhodanobacter sp.]
MFRLRFGFSPRHVAIVGMVALGLSLSVSASEPPSIGLGQAWPNAQDVSRSSQFHVYVFVRDGVRYIQVNDLGGNIRVAFATANGQFLVLPTGIDASRANTSQALSVQNTVSSVYNDGTVQVGVRSSNSGLVWTAASVNVGAPAAVQSAQSHTLLMSGCTDPAQCDVSVISTTGQ